MSERLHKFMARCGIASRRRCEELILGGTVTVDGEVVRKLGTTVDPASQIVEVAGQRLRPSTPCYFALHKPKGVVCTHHDPARRTRAIDLIPGQSSRLFPIGRLDEDSEGLLLLTNDGELAQRVAHPRFQVTKVYRLVVRGPADGAVLEKLRKGVWLPEGRTAPAKVEVLRKTREQTTLSIALREGKNRHLRRILARLELPVRRLQRVRIGPVRLGTLKRGEWRPLSPAEVEALREGLSFVPGRGPRHRRSAGRRGSSAKRAGKARKPGRPAGRAKAGKKGRRRATRA